MLAKCWDSSGKCCSSELPRALRWQPKAPLVKSRKWVWAVLQFWHIQGSSSLGHWVLLKSRGSKLLWEQSGPHLQHGGSPGGWGKNKCPLPAVAGGVLEASSPELLPRKPHVLGVSVSGECVSVNPESTCLSSPLNPNAPLYWKPKCVDWDWLNVSMKIG